MLSKILLNRAISLYTIGLFILASFSNLVITSKVRAKPVAASTAMPSFSPPPPPPDRKAPGNRGGASGRGCRLGRQFVLALMPEYKQMFAQGGEITKVWGLTTAERPTFWFDIPYAKEAIASMEFVLQDSSTPAHDIYRTQLTAPDQPGIISVRIPSTVPPLRVGDLYQWFFKVRLKCEAKPDANQPVFKQRIPKEELYGWIERVSPSPTLAEQLQQATPQQQTALYIENGIWYDALAALAELRLANPQSSALTEDWQSLLKSVGLESLATKPLTGCCSL